MRIKKATAFSSACICVHLRLSLISGPISVLFVAAERSPTILTPPLPAAILPAHPGEVAEWLNAPVSKTGRPARVAGVRISPSPFSAFTSAHCPRKSHQATTSACPTGGCNDRTTRAHERIAFNQSGRRRRRLNSAAAGASVPNGIPYDLPPWMRLRRDERMWKLTESSVVWTGAEDSGAAGEDLGRQIREQLGGNPPDAVILFVSPKYDPAKLLSSLKGACAPKVMIGCSSAGEFTSGCQGVGHASAVAIRSSEMQFACIMGRGLHLSKSAQFFTQRPQP